MYTRQIIIATLNRIITPTCGINGNTIPLKKGSPYKHVEEYRICMDNLPYPMNESTTIMYDTIDSSVITMNYLLQITQRIPQMVLFKEKVKPVVKRGRPPATTPTGDDDGVAGSNVIILHKDVCVFNSLNPTFRELVKNLHLSVERMVRLSKYDKSYVLSDTHKEHITNTLLKIKSFHNTIVKNPSVIRTICEVIAVLKYHT